MKGTLEKLRRIFISKKRQEEDLSASKFSRSMSFKKGSMRKSLRRLTRRKAVVTNHGIIYVEGDPNSPTTPTPPNLAAAFAFGPRAVSSGVSKGVIDGARTGDSDPHGGRGVAGSDESGPVRDGSGAVSAAAGGSASTAATRSNVSPSAGRASSGDASTGIEASSGPPAPARLSVGVPELTNSQSPRISGAGPKPAAPSLASSTGNIPACSARPKVRRPTDSLPRPPTEVAETAEVAEAQDNSRRASHCGVTRAVEAPRTPQLAGRTAKIMSASVSPKKADSGAAAGRSDSEDDTKPAEEHATADEVHEGEKVNAAKGETEAATGQDSDASRLDEGSPSAEAGASGGGGGGGARRRLPTVTATRDHLRRSLRRLSERRRKSRRPESVVDAPSAGFDFYKMFSRVQPVLAPGTSVPSTPFTFSRKNPITQWLAESEVAQQAAKRAPGSADWDALLWSELVMSPPAGEKEARKRSKRASKKAGRARRSGLRTSSEASAASVGTAASGAELDSAGKVESEVTPQALKA